MQKYIFIMLIALLSSCSEGGNFPEVIKNTATAKHTNIPGTRLSVIIPPGFSIAGGYMGLRKSSAVLQVYDLTDGNFFNSGAIYNKDKFEREGAQILEYKDVVVDGFKGKYIHMKNNDNTLVYTLAFGDSTFCTTVLGIYHEDEQAEGKELKGILESIAYDVNKKIDPFSRAVFKIDDTASAFKFSKLTGSAYIYTWGGKDLKFNDDEPYVIITAVNYNAVTPLPAIADSVFKTVEDEHGMTERDIKNAQQLNTYNYPAYEREVYGMSNGKLTLLYELALVKDKNMVVYAGHSKTDFTTNLALFKELSRTITFK